jgi:hypothetical protein
VRSKPGRRLCASADIIGSRGSVTRRTFRAFRNQQGEIRDDSAQPVAIAIGSLACERDHVTVELPTGRALSRAERRELQQIANVTFLDVRAQLDGLPSRLTLAVRWGKDVIPETGENGAAFLPKTIACRWTPIETCSRRSALTCVRRSLTSSTISRARAAFRRVRSWITW